MEAPPAGLFFTGTDTGVGKTFVAAAVAGILRQQGHSVRVCKPVATGAALVGGEWLNDDTVRLAEAAGIPREQWRRVTPWTFPDPVAPPVAARARGITLRLSDLAEAVLAQAQVGTALLVEGVGGLLCPLTENETVADLATRLAMPLVVVVRRALGTLNHTLLTLEVAGKRNLPVAGIVVNETSWPKGLADETNVEELRRRITVPILAVVPFQNVPSSATLPALAGVDWWRLCGRTLDWGVQ